MITQDLLQWGAKHSHSKVRQLAMHLINLSQAVRTDAERMQQLSEFSRNMSVQLWVSGRLNQELASLMVTDFQTAEAVSEAIQGALDKVLTEAKEKGVPDAVLETMRAHFNESVSVQVKEKS